MNGFSFFERSVRIDAAALTDPGCRRSENQDSFVATDLQAIGSGWAMPQRDARGVLAWSASFELGAKGALFLVADGMGGAASGALASRLAVDGVVAELGRRWVSDRASSPQRFAGCLREALEATNQRIYRYAEQEPAHHGMGTTTTAVGVLDGFLHIAQVGDSRAYLVRNGLTTQLTHDQSLVQQLVSAGAMTEEQAEQSPHGSLLLQALGTAPQVEVALSYEELSRGDVLVACSDGLFRVVRNDEIAQIVQGNAAPAALCAALVSLANERGGPDNVTVIVARFEGEGLPEARA